MYMESRNRSGGVVTYGLTFRVFLVVHRYMGGGYELGPPIAVAGATT